MVSKFVPAGMSLIFGSIGDLASRIMFYNCSVDKIWTLLFVLPPFSIVTAIMYFMEKIAPGSSSCSSSLDLFLFVIPVIGMLVAYALKYFVENQMIIEAVMLISMFVLFMLVRMYKSYSKCDENSNTSMFSSNIVVRAMLISAAVNGGIFALNKAAPYLTMVPVVGMAFRVWGMLDVIPGLQHMIPLVIMHFVMNLFENMPDSIQKLCK